MARFALLSSVALATLVVCVAAVSIPDSSGSPITGVYTNPTTILLNASDYTLPAGVTTSCATFTDMSYTPLRCILHHHGSDVIDHITEGMQNFEVVDCYEQFIYGDGTQDPLTIHETVTIIPPANTRDCEPDGREPFRCFDFDASDDFNRLGQKTVKKMVGDLGSDGAKCDMTHWQLHAARSGPRSFFEVQPILNSGASDYDANAYFAARGYPIIANLTVLFYGPAFGCVEDILVSVVIYRLEKNATIQQVRAEMALGRIYTELIVQSELYDPNFFACLAGSCQCPNNRTLPHAKRSTGARRIPLLTGGLRRALFDDRIFSRTMTAEQRLRLEEVRNAHLKNTAVSLPSTVSVAQRKRGETPYAGFYL